MNSLKPNVVNVDISMPIFPKAVQVSCYISTLQNALEVMIPAETRFADDSSLPRPERNQNRLRYNDYSASIKNVQDYCDLKHLDEVTVNEALILELHEHYKATRNPELKSKDKTASRITALTNLIPSIQRPLVTLKQYQKSCIFANYSPLTKELLEDFGKNGRMLRKDGTPTPELMENSTRRNVVGNVRLLLKKVGKTDILNIDADDINDFIDFYAEEDRRNTAIKILCDIHCFFRYLVAKGVIKIDLLADYTEKPDFIDRDFVTQESIDKLSDVSNVTGFYDVRNRLCIFLAYDFALRNGEIVRLNVEDIKLAEDVQINLRSEIQKGKNKMTMTYWNYFPPTKILMERYLKLRQAKNPTTNALLISEDGSRLLEQGNRMAIKSVGRELGIKTYEGKIPSGHRYRHSFGSLNISELGVGLDVYGIMNRLRHTDYNLTRQVYITENVMLQEAQHKALMRRKAGAVGNSNVPTTPPTIASVAHVEPVEFITEKEAFKIFDDAKISLSTLSLRKYANEHGHCRNSDGNYSYSKTWAQDLASNYVSREKAMWMLKVEKSAFWYWITTYKIFTVDIGKSRFLKRQDVMERIENLAERTANR